MSETAFAAAFQKAGIKTGLTKLFMVATDLLRRVGRNPVIAHDGFVEAVMRDAELLKAILADELQIGDGDLRDACLRYLRKRAGDMVNRAPAKAVEPQKMDGDGQWVLDAQPANASPSAPLPGEGQNAYDTQSVSASPGQPDARSEDHLGDDAQRSSVNASRSPNRDDGGHQARDIQECTSAVAREPSKVIPMARRGLKEMAAAKAVAGPSIFDTIHIRGWVIGDLTFSQLEKLVVQNKHELALLRLILDEGIPPDPEWRVRQYVSLERFQRIVQKAAEISDAA